MSELKKEQWLDSDFRNRMEQSFDTPEWKAVHSECMSNQWKDPESALRAHSHSEGHRKAMSERASKFWQDPENWEYMSKLRQELWKDPDYVKKQKESRHASPNKAELYLLSHLEKWLPGQYKYVGDFSLIIGGKCPDYIHTKKKLIIELFGNYWHGELLTGQTSEQVESERTQYFQELGYETLIIWEYELEDLQALWPKVTQFTTQKRKAA